MHSDYAGTLYVRHCKHCDIMYDVEGYQAVKTWNKADVGLKLAYLPEHRNQKWLRGSSETVISAEYVTFFTAAMQTMHSGFSQMANLVNYMSSITIEKKRLGKGEAGQGFWCVICTRCMTMLMMVSMEMQSMLEDRRGQNRCLLGGRSWTVADCRLS